METGKRCPNWARTTVRGTCVVRKGWLSAKKKTFYMKLIMYTLLVSLLPIFILSFLFFRNARETMQTELRAANAKYLDQSVATMEIVTNQISSSFRQLSFDKVIREFESFPGGLYYEGLKGSYADVDLPVLYDYLESKKRLSANLGILRSSNEFIYSVYFYDNNKKAMFTSDGLQYTLELFYDPGWNEFAGTIVSFPTFTELRKSKSRDGSDKDVIPLVYMSPFSGNYLVINLDVDALYDSFISKLTSRSDSAFFVVSKSGKLMLFHESNALNGQIGTDPRLRELLRSEKRFSYENRFNGRAMLVSFLTSDTLGWTFVTATALDELYRSVDNIRKTIVLMCLLLVAATGLLALATARNIYHPVLRLLQFINQKDRSAGLQAEHREPGEFRLIRSSLEEAFEDKARLQMRFLENLPAIQEKFVRTLVRRPALEQEEIADRLQLLGLDLQLHEILLLLVSLEETRGQASDVEHEMNKLRLIDSIREQMSPGRKKVVAELDEDLIMVLVNCGPHDFQEMTGCAERLIGHVDRSFGIKCSIGIGKHCAGIGELGRAYEEARDALRYRKISCCEVIYIEDVRLENTPKFIYPKTKETLLINCIVNGDKDQAVKLFAELIEDIREQQEHVHAYQIQHAFIQLLSGMMTVSGDLRVDLNQVMQEKRNLFSVLLMNNDFHNPAVWLEEMVMKLSAHIGEAFREKGNQHVAKALRMIRDDCAEPLSLTVVAERLGLNSSYLSRIFKEHTGETFSECLIRSRIEQSRRMLVETNMKIKDIGEKIGYYKTNYYIKLFKDYTGVTPSEYRKLNLNGQTDN